MSAKIKILTVICSFSLLICCLVMGVLAGGSAEINAGGDLAFVAKNIYCEINGSYEGLDNEVVLDTLRWDASQGQEPATSATGSWSGTTLTFGQNADEVIFAVTIQNLSETVDIDFSVSIDTSKDNLTVYDRAYSFNNATYQVGETVSITAGTTATFKIVYTPSLTETSQEEQNFSYIFSLISDVE